MNIYTVLVHDRLLPFLLPPSSILLPLSLPLLFPLPLLPFSAPVGRQQPKPVKLKRFNKVKDHEIRSCACGPHTTAMISKDGKLFMFGSLEDDIVDKTSGT